MPVLARLASSNPAAYEYLMDSIEAWPRQAVLSGWLREAGFERVAYRNLTAGIVALHRGFVPETVPAPSHQIAEAVAGAVVSHEPSSAAATVETEGE